VSKIDRVAMLLFDMLAGLMVFSYAISTGLSEILSHYFMPYINISFSIILMIISFFSVGLCHNLLHTLLAVLRKELKLTRNAAENSVKVFLIIYLLLFFIFLYSKSIEFYADLGYPSGYLAYKYYGLVSIVLAATYLSHYLNSICGRWLARRFKGIARSKVKHESNRSIKYSFFDYYVIYCIYCLSISLFGGFLIYGFMSIYSRISFSALVIFYMLELILLYSNKAVDIALDKDNIVEFKSLRALPTPGILFASPLLLFYFLVRLKDSDYCSWNGLKKIWIISIYLITNPRLPKLNAEDDITLGKLLDLKIYSDEHIATKNRHLCYS
jgi:hypothetical protein